MDYDRFCKLTNKDYKSANELKELEKYKVRNAVIMAAGLGSRMRPITDNIPKPLVTINGIRLIETGLNALENAGIENIYIVRGYLGKQFDSLLCSYPNVKFIENELYDKGNNITSILAAKEHICNAYVLPADLFISNASIIKPYQFQSGAWGVKVDKTDDWCLETTSDGIVTRCGIGGVNCYKDIGIFYWNEEDGKKISEYAEDICKTYDGMQRYWSNIPFVLYPDKFKVRINVCSPEDAVEFDTIEELSKYDDSYKAYLESR